VLWLALTVQQRSACSSLEPGGGASRKASCFHEGARRHHTRDGSFIGRIVPSVTGYQVLRITCDSNLVKGQVIWIGEIELQRRSGNERALSPYLFEERLHSSRIQLELRPKKHLAILVQNAAIEAQAVLAQCYPAQDFSRR
jgi:hypothetical protein